MGIKSPQVVIEEVVVKQAAALCATGATAKEVADQLGITPYHMRKIMAHPKFKETVRTIGDTAVDNAKAIIRTETSKLANKVMKVLNVRLDKDDLDAVKVALKIVGFDQQEEKAQGDTNISVVLPGAVSAAPKQDIEDATYVEVEDGSDQDGVH